MDAMIKKEEPVDLDDWNFSSSIDFGIEFTGKQLPNSLNGKEKPCTQNSHLQKEKEPITLRNLLIYGSKPNLQPRITENSAEKKCKKCIFIGETQDDLTKHIKETHAITEHSLLCHFCGFLFYHTKNFLHHMKLIHHSCESTKLFSCSICDFNSLKKNSLRKHISRVHKKEKNAKCHQCGHEFFDQTALKQHILLKHTPPKIQCKFCHYKTNNSGGMKYHMKYTHLVLGNLEEFHCSFCNYFSYKKRLLKAHTVRKHYQRQKKFICHHCGYFSYYKYSLKLHILRRHISSSKIHCRYCTHKSSSKKLLQIHVKKVHLKIKNKLCPMCKYKTNTTSKLRNHYKIRHLNIKPPKKPSIDYFCYHCGRSKKSKAQIKMHILRDHLKIKFKCKFCGLKSTTELGLKLHINLKHSRMNKKYKCSECDYKAARQDYLNKHKLSCHSSEKNYECPHCGHSSARSDNMKAHIKRVHNLKSNTQDLRKLRTKPLSQSNCPAVTH